MNVLFYLTINIIIYTILVILKFRRKKNQKNLFKDVIFLILNHGNYFQIL